MYVVKERAKVFFLMNVFSSLCNDVTATMQWAAMTSLPGCVCCFTEHQKYWLPGVRTLAISHFPCVTYFENNQAKVNLFIRYSDLNWPLLLWGPTVHNGGFTAVHSHACYLSHFQWRRVLKKQSCWLRFYNEQIPLQGRSTSAAIVNRMNVNVRQPWLSRCGEASVVTEE